MRPGSNLRSADFSIERFLELVNSGEGSEFDAMCNSELFEGGKRKIFDIEDPTMQKFINKINELGRSSKLSLVYRNSDFFYAATEPSVSLKTLKYLVEKIKILEYLSSEVNEDMRKGIYSRSKGDGSSELKAEQESLDRCPYSLMPKVIMDFRGQGHEKVKYLVSQGGDINASEYHNIVENFKNPPLISILANENWQLARDFFSWLIEYNRSDFLWDSVDSADTSILAFAVSMNAPVDIIRTILENLNPNQVNAQDFKGRSALHFASLLRRSDIIPALLARGANPDLEDMQGKKAEAYLNCQSNDIYKFLNEERTIFPLRDEKAACNALQSSTRVNLIITPSSDVPKGAIIYRIPYQNNIPAWAATAQNARLFLTNTSNTPRYAINSAHEICSLSPENLDCMKNYVRNQLNQFSGTSLIHSILDLGRKKKCQRSFKFPLLSAVEQGDLESIRRFLKIDSTDIQCADLKTDETALDIAFQGENPRIILALWNADTNPSETGLQSSNNETLEHLLRLASAEGGEKNEKLVKAVLERRTDINCDASGEKTGQTALHWAVKRGNFKIAEILISRGASLLTADKTGKTPLQLMKDKKIHLTSIIHPARIPLTARHVHSSDQQESSMQRIHPAMMGAW